MKRSENELRKPSVSPVDDSIHLEETEEREMEEKLSDEEIKEVRDFLQFLKSDEARQMYEEDDCDCEEHQHVSAVPSFFGKLNKTILFICFFALTFVCWLCFKGLFLSILLIIEVLFASVFLIYSTSESDSITLDAVSDGLKYIQPDENGKKLRDLVMQAPVEELQDLVDYIKNPEEFDKISFQPETKVLLVGETGFGKDALIHAFSNETELPIIRVNGSRFFDTENIMDKLFSLVQKYPTLSYVIHIENFEKIASHGVSMTEDPETLIDKLRTYLTIFPNVILIATCEDTSSIMMNEDAYATLFKKVIVLDTPDQKERVKLLQEFTSELILDSNIDFEQIAKNCYGLSIGELKYLVATAISISRKNQHKTIQMEDFYNAFDVMEFGKTGKKHSEQARKIAAYHEAGHALVHYLKNGSKNLLRVISIGRGDFGGLTFFSPDEEKMVSTEEDLMTRVCISYGGRCAEKIIFGHLSTGPSTDIQHATAIITSMVRQFGMSEELGPLNFSPKIAMLSVINESPEVRNKISAECIRIAKECEEKTMNLLKDHRDMLDKLANYLMEHESITGEEMDALLKEE